MNKTKKPKDVTPEGSSVPVFTNPDAPEPLEFAPEEIVRDRRRSAFTEEADPLFFKEQAGEIEPGTWMAKREEIRNRLPYPKK